MDGVRVVGIAKACFTDFAVLFVRVVHLLNGHFGDGSALLPTGHVLANKANDTEFRE